MATVEVLLVVVILATASTKNFLLVAALLIILRCEGSESGLKVWLQGCLSNISDGGSF